MTVRSPQATRPSFEPISVSRLSFWRLTAQECESHFKVLRDERPVGWHHRLMYLPCSEAAPKIIWKLA